MSAKKSEKQEAWIKRIEDVPGGEAVVERNNEFSYRFERARRLIEDDSILWTAAEGHQRRFGAREAGAGGSNLKPREPWLLEV